MRWMRRLRRRMFRWRWHDAYQVWEFRLLGVGRARASVYPNGVWSTWDAHGIGGEISQAGEVWKAKLDAFVALERQGWL